MKKILFNPPPAEKGEINYPFADRFTFVHFMIGFGYGLLGLGFVAVLLLAFAWELIENILKANFPSLFPHASADTWQNSAGDGIAVIGGWMICRYVLFL